MHLELYEREMADSVDVEKVGEVRFNPYSYTYNGYSKRVEEYLSREPKFAKIVGVPSGLPGSPKLAEVTDEWTKLNRTRSDFLRKGLCEGGEIIDR